MIPTANAALHRRFPAFEPSVIDAMLVANNGDIRSMPTSYLRVRVHVCVWEGDGGDGGAGARFITFIAE